MLAGIEIEWGLIRSQVGLVSLLKLPALSLPRMVMKCDTIFDQADGSKQWWAIIATWVHLWGWGLPIISLRWCQDSIMVNVAHGICNYLVMGHGL